MFFAFLEGSVEGRHDHELVPFTGTIQSRIEQLLIDESIITVVHGYQTFYQLTKEGALALGRKIFKPKAYQNANELKFLRHIAKTHGHTFIDAFAKRFGITSREKEEIQKAINVDGQLNIHAKYVDSIISELKSRFSNTKREEENHYLVLPKPMQNTLLHTDVITRLLESFPNRNTSSFKETEPSKLAFMKLEFFDQHRYVIDNLMRA